MSAIQILGKAAKLSGMRLFFAVVAVALVSVGALTLRMGLATSGVMQGAVVSSGEASASDARIADRWAALDEAYRRQYALVTAEQVDRQRAYWAAINQAYQARYGLSGVELSDQQKAYWTAADEAYRKRAGLLASERSDSLKAYWTAANNSYQKQYDLTLTDQANRQKAYWAAVTEFYVQRIGMSGATVQ